MTRKDFLLLSSSIKATLDRVEADYNTGSVSIDMLDFQRRGIRRAAAHIANAIYVEQGSRFDVVRFLKDCGFGATTIGVAMHEHLTGKTT